MADGAESKATARRGRRRLAWLLVAVAVVVVVASGAAFLVARDDTPAASAAGEPWFAPYVATTVTPILRFDDPVAAPSAALVLGFVVAAGDDSCTPSWGAHYGLDEAAAAPLELDAQIDALRNQGREAMISFGGAANTELALRCPDAAQLAAAYAQVVDRYGVRRLDFDLEGAALHDGAATARRAAAVRELQDRAGAAGSGLEVALTLPVGRHGLGEEGVAQLDAMLAAGVDVGNVNALTMDYAGSMTPGMTMSEVSTAALEATFQQVTDAYARAGERLDAASVWAQLGATPMIGQNDVPGEVFTLEDAHHLRDYATARGLGRLSMWSMNRDRSCPPAASQPVSATCSGVEQQPSEFARVLSGEPAG